MRKIIIEREGMVPAETIAESEHLTRGDIARYFYQLSEGLREVRAGADPGEILPVSYLDETGFQRLVFMMEITDVRMFEGGVDCTDRFLGGR